MFARPRSARCRHWLSLHPQTQISLSTAERALLDQEAARTGRSMAALIRDAIEVAYGRGRERATDLDALAASAGSWQRDEDGAAFVERLRSGDRLP